MTSKPSQARLEPSFLGEKKVMNLQSTKLLFIATVSTVAFVTSTQSEVLFESYSQILNNQKPIGYTIQRREYDPKKKQFISTYYIKTNKFGGAFTETLKAQCDKNFVPISYQYTAHSKNSTKTIDAQFKKHKNKHHMTAVIKEGAKTKRVKKTFSQEVFLSTFLSELMLRKNLTPKKKFVYEAIAEEEAQSFLGQTVVQNLKTRAGSQSYTLANEFRGSAFTSEITSKGAILSTHSPTQKLKTRRVARLGQATRGLKTDHSALKKLFGDTIRIE